MKHASTLPLALLFCVHFAVAAEESTLKEKVDAVFDDALRGHDIVMTLHQYSGRLPGARDIYTIPTLSGLIDMIRWDGEKIWVVSDSEKLGSSLSLTLVPTIEPDQRLSWTCTSLASRDTGIPRDCTSELNSRLHHKRNEQIARFPDSVIDSREELVPGLMRFTNFPRVLIGDYFRSVGTLPAREEFSVLPLPSAYVIRVSWTGAYLWMLLRHEFLEKDLVLRITPHDAGDGTVAWSCENLASLPEVPADCTALLP